MNYHLFLPGQPAQSIQDILAQKPECIVGSDASSDFRVQDRFVEPVHFTLNMTHSGGLFLHPKAKRPILINGELAEQIHPLTPGFYKINIGNTTLSLDIFDRKFHFWREYSWLKIILTGILLACITAHQIIQYDALNFALDEHSRLLKKMDPSSAKSRISTRKLALWHIQNAKDARRWLLISPSKKPFEAAVTQTLWVHVYESEDSVQVDTIFRNLSPMLSNQHIFNQFDTYWGLDSFLNVTAQAALYQKQKGSTVNQPLEVIKELQKSVRYNAIDSLLVVLQGKQDSEGFACLNRNGINVSDYVKKESPATERKTGIKLTGKTTEVQNPRSKTISDAASYLRKRSE